MISFQSKGSFNKTFKYLNRIGNIFDSVDLNYYGSKGIDALEEYAPKDSGLLAKSWAYEIKKTKNSCTITWFNKDIEDGYNIAILVQYGHASKKGTFVKGIDFVNPAMKPIFEEIASKIIKEVDNA